MRGFVRNDDAKMIERKRIEKNTVKKYCAKQRKQIASFRSLDATTLAGEIFKIADCFYSVIYRFVFGFDKS